MSATLTSPVTGSALTGLTSPTYTLAADASPDQSNGKQYAVTALGGTQAGVTVHSVSSPFTINFKRPIVLKILQAVTNQLQLIGVVPRNTYSLIIRKGVTVLSGQPAIPATVRVEWVIPAGSDTNDAANLAAMNSLLGGALVQNLQGYVDSTKTAVI